MIAFLGTVAGLILLWVLGICCSPEHGILGRWQVEGDDSPEYIEFFSDGTARLEFDNTWLDEPAETVDYEITEDNQLVLSNGEESSTANFELKDDVYLVLDLYDEEETKIYRRVSE